MLASAIGIGSLWWNANGSRWLGDNAETSSKICFEAKALWLEHKRSLMSDQDMAASADPGSGEGAVDEQRG